MKAKIKPPPTMTKGWYLSCMTFLTFNHPSERADVTVFLKLYNKKNQDTEVNPLKGIRIEFTIGVEWVRTQLTQSWNGQCQDRELF